MLIGAGIRNGGNPMRVLGGAQAMTVERWGWEQRGPTLNFYGGEATVVGGTSIANKNGVPSGYLPPRSFFLPIKAGGMSTHNRILATSTLTAALQAGWPTSAALTSTSSVDAVASLIVSLIAAITGSTTVTAAASGAAGMAVGMTGTASVSAAATGIASVVASLAGSSDVSAFLTALADMDVDVGSTGTALTADSIATAVWANGVAISLVNAVDLVRKISDNRLEVDIPGQRLVLYDDDGTTELRAWSLSTTGGENVATSTGVQTKRGAGA